MAMVSVRPPPGVEVAPPEASQGDGDDGDMTLQAQWKQNWGDEGEGEGGAEADALDPDDDGYDVGTRAAPVQHMSFPLFCACLGVTALLAFRDAGVSAAQKEREAREAEARAKRKPGRYDDGKPKEIVRPLPPAALSLLAMFHRLRLLNPAPAAGDVGGARAVGVGGVVQHHSGVQDVPGELRQSHTRTQSMQSVLSSASAGRAPNSRNSGGRTGSPLRRGSSGGFGTGTSAGASSGKRGARGAGARSVRPTSAPAIRASARSAAAASSSRTGGARSGKATAPGSAGRRRPTTPSSPSTPPRRPARRPKSAARKLRATPQAAPAPVRRSTPVRRGCCAGERPDCDPCAGCAGADSRLVCMFCEQAFRKATPGKASDVPLISSGTPVDPSSFALAEEELARQHPELLEVTTQYHRLLLQVRVPGVVQLCPQRLHVLCGRWAWLTCASAWHDLPLLRCSRTLPRLRRWLAPRPRSRASPLPTPP